MIRTDVIYKWLSTGYSPDCSVLNFLEPFSSWSLHLSWLKFYFQETRLVSICRFPAKQSLRAWKTLTSSIPRMSKAIFCINLSFFFKLLVSVTAGSGKLCTIMYTFPFLYLKFFCYLLYYSFSNLLFYHPGHVGQISATWFCRSFSFAIILLLVSALNLTPYSITLWTSYPFYQIILVTTLVFASPCSWMIPHFPATVHKNTSFWFTYTPKQNFHLIH